LKRTLERWETKLANCELIPQVILPIAKSLSKRSGPKTPSAGHGPIGLIFNPIDKANINADRLENQSRTHDLCDCDYRRYMEGQFEALLATFDEENRVKFRPHDISKEILSSKFGKACSFDDIPNECLQHLPKNTIVYLTHLFNHCLRLDHLPTPWKEGKNHNCETQQRSKIASTFTFDQPLLYCGQTIS
jgi:hypothetical protein